MNCVYLLCKLYLQTRVLLATLHTYFKTILWIFLGVFFCLYVVKRNRETWQREKEREIRPKLKLKESSTEDTVSILSTGTVLGGFFLIFISWIYFDRSEIWKRKTWDFSSWKKPHISYKTLFFFVSALHRAMFWCKFYKKEELSSYIKSYPEVSSDRDIA